MTIALKAGDNLVVYAGKAQSAANAFASIVSYLTIAYYWNNIARLYEQVVTTTMMVPYGVYSVEVTQDCTWSYGADETPLDSVQLYSGDAGIVPYCGPRQSVESALTSIWSYFQVGYYFDNSLKEWVLLYPGYMMVPNTPYAIGVSQDCVWSFAAPGNYTEITKLDVPASAVVGEQVEMKVTVKNVTTAPIYISVTALVNGTAYNFGDEYATPSPGQEATFTDVFTMVGRDVDITVVSWYYGTDGIWHQDDSATATVLLTTAVETLEVDITPVGVGYVTTEPASVEGKTEWHDDDTGTFPRGTNVRVTAHPNTGYVFDHWSDEIVGGVSYQNPEYVKTMTEHRAVKAHFRAEEEPQVQTLEVDITPSGAGHVTTVPASEEGKSTWYDDDTGTFPHNTIVEVTAIPATGYVFDHWSNEIVGGVSYENPSYVQPMTQHRAVKAHFVVEGEAEVETLEVDITPEGKGYVTTDPASIEGVTEWHHDTIGTFPYGISVQVTAHPSEGYRFEKWSDEIEGGVSYANPAMVQDMTQRRTVKCHFREIAAPPDGEGITEVMVIHGTGLVTGTEKSLPVSGVEVDDWFKIKVTGVNPSASESQMGLHFIITKPDGSVMENTVVEAWPYTGGGASHTFIEPGIDAYTVDQAGDWSLSFELLGDETVIDTWEGLMFSSVVTPPPSVLDMIPMLIMVMMMSMMMNIMPQLTEEVPKLGRKAWEATKEVAPVVAKKAAKKLFKV